MVFAVAPGIAAAADLTPEPPPPPPAAPATYAPPPSDWIVTVGAEVRAIPAWPGASTTEYGFTGFPLFALQKPGDPPFFFLGRATVSACPFLISVSYSLGQSGNLYGRATRRPIASSMAWAMCPGRADRRLRRLLAGAVAVRTWRSSSRNWRRNRRERRPFHRRGGAAGPVAALRRPAPVAAIDGCCRPLFQYYGGAVCRLRASRPQRDRRLLFLWRGRPGGVFLEPAMADPRFSGSISSRPNSAAAISMESLRITTAPLLRISRRPDFDPAVKTVSPAR
jgi:hypothetical protein